jgi:acetyl esterase/lipase
MVVPPIANGIAYFSALRSASIPAEIHIFEAGGHGFGLASTLGRPDAAWPDLLLRWGASHSFFKTA